VSVPQSRPWYSIERAAADVADVSIFDEISPWGVTAADFVAELASVTAPVVNLHLNTPGGICDDGIAIYNAIKSHPAEFRAFIPGICASIGTVIAMAADRIAIAPHARMMIHEAWGGVMGSAEDFAKAAIRYDAMSQNIASVYAERAGGDVEEWRDRMKAESWYTDQEAVAVGLADEVARVAADPQARRAAALFNLSAFAHGDREAALLRRELADDGVHACVCGQDGCPLSAPEPPAAPANHHVHEREALEAALAAVVL